MQSAIGIVALLAILLLAGYRVVLWLCGIIVIPDDSVGVVTKKFRLARNARKVGNSPEPNSSPPMRLAPITLIGVFGSRG